MENPIKMDDLGIPLFLETFISHKSLQFLSCWDVFGGILDVKRDSNTVV